MILKLLLINTHLNNITSKTNFKDNFKTNLNNYLAYSINRKHANRANGDFAFTNIKSNIPSKRINLISEFEAITVTVQCKEEITFYHIY